MSNSEPATGLGDSLVQRHRFVALLADAHVLRQRAETRFTNSAGHSACQRAESLPDEVRRLMRELQVRQIELELQNEALRQSHLALDSARERYFDLYDKAPVGYVTLAVSGLILEVNRTAATLLGLQRCALVGHLLHAFVAREDQDSFYLLQRRLDETGDPQSCELRMTHQDGHQVWVHLTASATTTAEGVHELRMVLNDINALKSLERQLERQAHFDALTNLPNRLLNADRLHQAMAQARRTGQGLAVVFIDLDGFKAINDRFGHAAGDEMLVAVTSHMKQVLREGDTLARMGGDEFVAVLINLGSLNECTPLLDRLLEAAAQPMVFSGERLEVTASLGVTFYPQANGVEADQLMRQSDQAMYQAKHAGRNRWQAFDAGPDADLRG